MVPDAAGLAAAASVLNAAKKVTILAGAGVAGLAAKLPERPWDRERRYADAGVPASTASAPTWTH